MFVRRDGSVKDKLSEIEHERRAGYSYYVSGAGKLLEEDYKKGRTNWGLIPMWLNKVR